MVGDLDAGLSIYQKEMRDIASRNMSYHSTYLTNLCLIYWMDADLIAMGQNAEGALNTAKDHQLPDTLPYVRYFQGIFHYHRNELEIAEEKLNQVVKIHHARSPMNYAHSNFALALTLQALGKAAKARKMSEAIVVHAVETNNTDLLQVARAFEAELALRQGRFTTASRWAGKYHAKPFLPTFRFYMPQLTLVKVLLAQDTSDSRRQAADVLEQLHDFVTFIHNNRIRIDVLALQALLYDSQNEESAALKTLTEALAVAEPGGFIRPFVDLGPKMADLLKRLVKQNVALRYIRRILAAFSSDERGAAVDESDHPVAYPSYLGTQPLVEPLTNREHEILELLAQRLRNKEIAAELFISTETVKKHLNRTYRKFNVSSRRQAVEKAQALGIL